MTWDEVIEGECAAVQVVKQLYKPGFRKKLVVDITAATQRKTEDAR